MEPAADAEQKRRDLTNLGKFESSLPELGEEYRSATPFPHVVLDQFLDGSVLHEAVEEFHRPNSEEWISYVHVNERKHGNTEPSTWGSTLQEILAELQSPRFVRFLEELTGIEDLLIDDLLEGGGLHQSTAGGFLNIHADFTVHPKKRTWQRRVNLLVYLNEEWPPEYGGDLELWSTDMKRCEVKVAPIGGRAVIFTTNPDSFHGHPDPMPCPEGAIRRSLALYYFSEERDPLVRSTEYRPRPGDSLARSTMIFGDKQVLRLYDRTKRRLGLNDQTIGKLLTALDRLRPRTK